MMNSSIRQTISILIIAFAASCAALFQFVWVPRVTQVLIDAETREIHRQIDVMADGLTPFILSNQYAAIYETLDVISRRHDNWSGIALVRADQKKIYPLGTLESIQGPDVIHLAHDIQLRGEFWGQLSANVDLSSQIASLHQELRHLAVVAIFVFVSIIILLGVLLDQLVIRRLSMLADAADELGSGNFRSALPRAARDEVGRLTRSFRVMREQILENVSSLETARSDAESALHAKSRFLATMSHELRTPLNGIIPVAELLKASRLDNAQRQHVEIIEQSSKSLLSIIDDILDLTKIEEGRLDIRENPFGPARLTDGVAGMLRTFAEGKGLQLKLNIESVGSMACLGDEDRIRQVLVNLTGNAIKFTERGAVTIACRPVLETNDEITFLFEVEDTGIGISTDDQERVFERFEQAEGGLTRRFGGTGLGLSISKRLVQAMNGQIGVRSTPGKGSVFWFTLPLRKSADNAEQAVPETRGCALKCAADGEAIDVSLKVLVADDNAINREVAKAMITGMGHTVQTVSNGRDAYDLVAGTDFNVVFMDVHMPDMDGLEATRRIRALRSDRSRTRVVALTASVMQQDIADCRNAGMDDVLSKPLTLGSVADCFNQLNGPAANARI